MIPARRRMPRRGAGLGGGVRSGSRRRWGTRIRCGVRGRGGRRCGWGGAASLVEEEALRADARRHGGSGAGRPSPPLGGAGRGGRDPPPRAPYPLSIHFVLDCVPRALGIQAPGEGMGVGRRAVAGGLCPTASPTVAGVLEGGRSVLGPHCGGRPRPVDHRHPRTGHRVRNRSRPRPHTRRGGGCGGVRRPPRRGGRISGGREVDADAAVAVERDLGAVWGMRGGRRGGLSCIPPTCGPIVPHSRRKANTARALERAVCPPAIPSIPLIPGIPVITGGCRVPPLERGHAVGVS